MPLALAAYLTLVAALVLGAHSPGVGIALAGVALAIGAAMRDARAAGLALTFAAGTLAADAAARADAECRRRAVAARDLVAVVDDDARPGARVTARDARCALPLSLVVRGGRASAGDIVRVRGVGAPGGRGVLVRDAIVERTGDRATLAAWRARLGRTIDALFGDDAALVRALVVADASGLPRDLRDRYAAAGLVHLLSVSGMHVSIVAAALELLLGALRLSRRAAATGAITAVAAYVLLLGAPAPAVRAGTMLGAQLASRLLQRPTSPWAVLALGGTLPLLFDARAVFDLGYQLSMAGMASLVAGRALAARTSIASLEGWRRAVAHEVLVGCVASAVTAPVVAWCFARTSLVAPVANVAAAPIVALLQPALFLAVVLAPIEPLARHVAGGARLLARALDRVAELFASIPFASVSVEPSAMTAALCAVAAGAFLVACGARVAANRARATMVAASCVVAAIWVPLGPARPGGEVEMHVIDVGQGDAVAIRTPRGRWILVDAGRTWRGGDAGRRTVLPYLRRRGGALEAFVLSHPHADHVGGAATVLTAMRPARYWDAAYALGSDVYRASLTAAREAGVAWSRVRPGDSLVVDGVGVHVLAPDSAWTASLDDANLASVIVSVRWRRVRFLLVGDAEAEEERWLVERAERDPAVADAMRADVLKVAHHGSRTSSTPEFLDLVRPRLAVISVGLGNTYGHPSASVLARLDSLGAQVVRTDQWGSIVVRSDGRTLSVEAGEEQWIVPSRPDSSDPSFPQ